MPRSREGWEICSDVSPKKGTKTARVAVAREMLTGI